MLPLLGMPLPPSLPATLSTDDPLASAVFADP